MANVVVVVELPMLIDSCLSRACVCACVRVCSCVRGWVVCSYLMQQKPVIFRNAMVDVDHFGLRKRWTRGNLLALYVITMVLSLYVIPNMVLYILN